MATIETLKKHDGTTVYPQTTFDAVQKSDGTTLTNEIESKLTEPSSGLEVGKYLRVKSIDDDGHAVLEVCDLPMATATQNGIIKLNYSNGIKDYSDGLGINAPTLAQVDNRSTNYRPITPYILKYAVDSVICSTAESEALTDEQKVNARKRILGSWETIFDETLEEDTVFSLQLTKKYSNIIIRIEFPINGTQVYKYLSIYNESGRSFMAYPTAGASTIFVNWIYLDNISDGLQMRYSRSMSKGQETSSLYSHDSNMFSPDFGAVTLIKSLHEYAAGTEIKVYGFIE